MDIPNIITSKKGKHIEIFSDNCSVCKTHITSVEIGKCRGCVLEVFLMTDDSQLLEEKKTKYNITRHPTTIIDEEIKVEGMPSFLWLCGDDFYSKLKKEYPLTKI